MALTSKWPSVDRNETTIPVRDLFGISGWRPGYLDDGAIGKHGTKQVQSPLGPVGAAIGRRE